MAKESEPPVFAKRETQAETKPVKIRLNEVVLNPERYSHRGRAEFTKPKLKPLIDSIISEGLQVPVEFFRDAQGRLIVLKGHRRVTAMRSAAEDKTPGFAADMEIDALEVMNSTLEDRLLRSVLDNVNRATLSATERMQAGKVLYENGINSARAAFALGISAKQFDRDLRIAREAWMLQHVEDDDISASDASRLLEVAEKADRVKEFREDLEEWIVDEKRKLRDKQRLRIAKDGKELTSTDQQVKKQMTRALLNHWLELLGHRQRFDANVPFSFPAGVEIETGVLHVEALSLDLKNAPLEELAKVAAKLSKAAKDMIPFMTTRSVMDSPEGPQAQLRKDDQPYDLALLRDAGLMHLATPIEAELLGEASAIAAQLLTSGDDAVETRTDDNPATARDGA